MIRWSSNIFTRLFSAAFCLVVIFLSQELVAGWQRIASFPRIVGAGYFFNSQRGLITVDGEDADPFQGIPASPPQIWRTYDGGSTWQRSNVPFGYFQTAFNDIFMTDSLNGWVVFEVNYSDQNLWRTTDGGVNWFEVSGYVQEATSVYETSKGVMYTHRGLRRTSDRGLFISKDQGSSFTKLAPNGMNGLDFVDDSHGIASTFNSETLFTNDGGDSWFRTSQVTEAWGVYGEKGTSNFLIAGEQQSSSLSTTTTIVQSTDYGLSWRPISFLPIRNTGHIEGVGKTVYLQVDQGFIASSGLFRTTDGGFTWKNVGGPSNYRDTRFCVTGCNGAVVYAFDLYGNVYKTIDGGDGQLREDVNYLTFSKRDISFTADVCTDDNDSTRFTNNTCYPLTIVSIDFSNLSDEAVTSGALSFVSKPNLPLTLQKNSSAIVRLVWDPIKSSQSLPSTFQFVRFRCLVQGGVGTFDTLIAISATSLAKKVIADLDSTSYSLQPTDFCKYRDTLIRVKNPGCDTMYITGADIDNIANWQILTADGQDLPLTLPIIIPPGARITFKVRFLPTRTGVSTGNMKISLMQRNISVDTTLLMNAISFRSVAITSVEMVDFGSLSQCLLLDTTVSYKNESCEDILIDWADITPTGSFMIMNLPNFPLVLKPDSVLTLNIRYLPKKNLFENAQLELHATATGDFITIPMLLFGLGTPGSSQYMASIGSAPISMRATDVCGIGDTMKFWIKNPGCDSLTIEDVSEITSSTGIFTYTTSQSIPKVILGSNDSLLITVLADPLSVGSHSAQYRVHFQLADGSEYDTTYTVLFSVTRGPRTFSITPPSIDFDTLALCRERDDTFTLTNTGCADLTLDSMVLSDPHFAFLSNVSFPLTVPRGGTITVPVRYTSPTPGTYTGNMTVWSNADTLPIRIQSVKANTLDKDYFTLSLDNLADKPNAGDTIQIAALPDIDWIGKGVKEISFSIRYNSDLLTYFVVHEPPATDVATTITQLSPDEARLDVTISSTNEVRLEKGKPLALIEMITALTDTLYTPLVLSDVKINNGDIYYKDCILAASDRSDDFTLYLECGEAPLQHFLSGTPILFVSHPTPNPLTQRSGYRLTLPVTSLVEGEAELRLVDVAGVERNLYSFPSLVKGTNKLTLDLSSYESGIYQYIVSLKGTEIIPVRGKFVIMK